MTEVPEEELNERLQELYARIDDAPVEVYRGCRSRRGAAGPAAEVKRKLLELTEQGHGHVEDHLDVAVDWTGRGGGVHRFWQQRIRDWFEEAGWAASVELFDANVCTSTPRLRFGVTHYDRETTHEKSSMWKNTWRRSTWSGSRAGTSR